MVSSCTPLHHEVEVDTILAPTCIKSILNLSILDPGYSLHKICWYRCTTLSGKMFRKSSSQFHSCNKRLTYKFYRDYTCWYLTLFQVEQIQDSHKDFQISVKTFPLTYSHFEEWMSLQPILKTLSFEFSVQVHFWSDNDTNKSFTLYQGYISPCFQLLLSYSATHIYRILYSHYYYYLFYDLVLAPQHLSGVTGS